MAAVGAVGFDIGPVSNLIIAGAEADFAVEPALRLTRFGYAKGRAVIAVDCLGGGVVVWCRVNYQSGRAIKRIISGSAYRASMTIKYVKNSVNYTASGIVSGTAS